MINIIAVGSCGGSLVMLELRRDDEGDLRWLNVLPDSEDKLLLVQRFITMRYTCSLENILQKLPGVIYIGRAYCGMPYEESHLTNVPSNLL